MVMTTRPLRILVVDDDPAMVGAITALVGTEGHQVITAYDGLTAVKRFREEAPDLVLLDLAMPGPDGFTVAGQIRAAGAAPILVVSGESAEAAKGKALGIGADDYLVKPFGKAELLAPISAVMRRGGPAGGGGAGAGPGAARGAGPRPRGGAPPPWGGARSRPGSWRSTRGGTTPAFGAFRCSSRRRSSDCSRRWSAPAAISCRTCSWPVPAGPPKRTRTCCG